MTKRIYLTVPEKIHDSIRDLAIRENRPFKYQAETMLERQAKKEGMLSDETRISNEVDDKDIGEPALALELIYPEGKPKLWTTVDNPNTTGLYIYEAVAGYVRWLVVTHDGRRSEHAYSGSYYIRWRVSHND